MPRKLAKLICQQRILEDHDCFLFGLHQLRHISDDYMSEKSYVYQPYPRMLYHWKLGTTTVQTEQQEREHLAKGWVNSPADVWKPQRLYHPNLKPDGHVFESPEEHAEALRNGWLTSPAQFPAWAPASAANVNRKGSTMLTNEQLSLLRLLAELYQSGRKTEFVISRTFDGSELLFGDGAENIDIEYDDSDFLALQAEALIRLYRDGRGDFHGKITGLGLDYVQEEPKPEVDVPAMSKRDVFVIHGRNEELRVAMFEFLRSLDLNPIEWDDLIARTKSAAPYIGQALDVGFKEAVAVVGFLTPDDLAMLHPHLLSPSDKEHERKLSPQARPNVLFELGMAFGLHPNRTVIVQLGDLRPFSDLGGRHVIHFDGSAKARTKLRDRLKAVGCEVKEHGSDWLTAGRFSVPSSDIEMEIENTSVLSTANKPFDKSVETDARHRAYSQAISILRKLTGEFFGANALPGYLWVKRCQDWNKIFLQLGSKNGNNGRFLPYTEPSGFNTTDEAKMEAAADILSLYLWSANRHADFETIRAQHALPDPKLIADYIEHGNLPNTYTS